MRLLLSKSCKKSFGLPKKKTLSLFVQSTSLPVRSTQTSIRQWSCRKAELPTLVMWMILCSTLLISDTLCRKRPTPPRWDFPKRRGCNVVARIACAHGVFLSFQTKFFLDLVNSDFSSNEQVTKILDSWDEKEAAITASHHGNAEDDEGVVNVDKKPLLPEIPILFSRHFKVWSLFNLMWLRDPIVNYMISHLACSWLFEIQSSTLDAQWCSW